MYELGIEAFWAIVRTRNLSQAAKQLNLAQSTVSKRLKVLEQEVGAILIERGKGFEANRLTLAGEAFIEIAERWAILQRDAQCLLIADPKLALSIGTLDSIHYGAFSSLYRVLNQHRPRISLKVLTSHSPDLYDLIDRREIDVAFTLLEKPYPNITVEKCYTEPMVGLRIASSSRSSSDIINPQDLDPNFELYVNWIGSGYQVWHDKKWNSSCPGRVYIDNAQLILSFLEDDRQWAIVPFSVAKIALTKGNYSIFHLSEVPPERVCYKITHKYPKASTVRALEVFDYYLNALLKQDFMPNPSLSIEK